MNSLSASLIGLLLLAPPALAGDLQKGRIPAQARWLVHLDVEAMKSSKLYEVVHQASAENGSNEMDEGLAQIRMFAGLDPTLDLRSVTLYSAAQSEEGCVALLAGNAKVDQALDKLKTMANYHTTPVQDYALHTWGDDHETWYAYVHRREGSDERVVIASQDSAELVRGIAVLEGDAESLAGSSRPPFRATPASGSILYAAAGESLRELGDVHPVSAIAKLAKSIVVDLGEDHGALSVHVVLDTRTPEDAQRVHQVLQGAVALVGLVGGENEEIRAKLQPLVDSLRLSVSNTRVEAHFRYDVAALIEEMKSLHELGDRIDESDGDAKVEKRKQRHEHRRRNREEEDK